MANGMLTPYTKTDALSSLGFGLLNLLHNNNINPSQLLALNRVFNAPQQPPNQQQFTGTNPSYVLPMNQTDDAVSRLMNSVAKLESSGNYSALGPATKSGDRAYGMYQVMGSNIPSWTKEVLGYSMTPEQFLASKEAQDAVARAKLGGYLNKYGNINDAASMWFSGRPYKNNMARDVLGTSVPQYVNTVNRYY